jgi:Tfp pilus assembly protein PilN
MKQLAPLGLDFVARRRVAGAGGWLLLLAGVAFALAATLDWQDAREETARWEDKAAQSAHAAQRAGRGGATVGDEVLRPQIDAAAKAVSRLAIPWGELYRCLEENADQNVSLLAVLPNPDKGELRLTGEARDFAALRGYLQRLGESGVLTDVRLLSHDLRESDAQKPVLFSLVAVWRISS